MQSEFIFFCRQGPSSLSPEEAAAWATEKRCKRKPGKECSPSEGPCCESNCQFTSSADNVQCKGADDCTDAAFCDGNNATCPKPPNKPDNTTECNQGTQVLNLHSYFTMNVCLSFHKMFSLKSLFLIF